MIDLKILAGRLEDTLNDARDFSRINELIPNTEIAFRVVLDTADYKEPERVDNHVTYYINALMRVIASETEGESVNNYNSSLTASIDFLVPLLDVVDEWGTFDIAEEVRALLINALQSGTFATIEDNGNIYLCGTKYRIANTGSRAVRERVGDSITFTVNAEYAFISNGVSSTEYKVYIRNGSNYEPVGFATLSMNRQTNSEPNLSSDEVLVEEGMTAKSTPINTVFAFSISSPVRNTSLDIHVADYLMNGVAKPIIIGFEIPNLSPIPMMTEKAMFISNVAISGQLNLAAAYTVTFTEYMEV